VGLLETKVKEEKAERIANNIFQGWNWHHNFTPALKGGFGLPGGQVDIL